MQGVDLIPDSTDSPDSTPDASFLSPGRLVLSGPCALIERGEIGVVRPSCLSPPLRFGRRPRSRPAELDEGMHAGAKGAAETRGRREKP